MTSRSKKYNYNIFLDGDLSTNNLNLGISTIFSGSFAASNNVVTPQNVIGLSFSNSATRSFQCQLSVTMTRSVGGNLYELFSLEGHQTDIGWNLYPTSLNDITGVVFSITSSGQIQYTSTNVSNFVNCIFRFVVTQIANAGTYSNLSSGTQGTYLLNSIQVLNTTNSILGTTPGALYVLGGSTFEKQLVIKTTENAVGLGTGGALSVFGGTSISKDLLIGGNVGIGTSVPTATLDVNGSINAGSLYVGGSISGGAGTASTFAYLTLTATDDAINLSTGSFVTYGGITIQSPTDASSVTGGGSFLTDGGASVGKRLFVGGGVVSASDTNTVGGIITTGGNVGIGTVTPSAKLDVDGTIRSTNITSTNVTTTNIVGTNASIGTVTATTYTGGSMSLSGNLTLAGTLTTVNITTTNISETNVSAGSITATNITAGGLTATNVSAGSITATNVSAGSVTATNITAGGLTATNVNFTTQTVGVSRVTTSLVAVGDSNTVGSIFTTGGNVGIGTTNPSAQLHLSSPTGLIALRIEGDTLNNLDDGQLQTQLQFRCDGGQGGINLNTYNYAGGNTNFSIEELRNGSETYNRLYIDNTNLTGYIGIGTTSPSDSLHIRTATVNANIASVVQNGSRQYRYGIRGDTANSFVIQDDTAPAIRLVINTAGNIGIGTTSPASRLHLANSSTAANIVFEAGSTADGGAANSGWAAINFNGFFNGTEQRINTSKNRWRLVCEQRTTEDKMFLETFNGGATTNLMTFTTAGNIGIGTQSPNSCLTILKNGGTSGTPLLEMVSNDTWGHGVSFRNTSTNGKEYQIYNYGTNGVSPGNLVFLGPTDSIMTLSSNNNVGIGTLTPGYRLDVNGSFRIAPRGYGESSSGIVNGIVLYNSQYNGSGDGTSIVFDHSFGNLGQDRLSSITSICPSGNYGQVTDLVFKTTMSGVSGERMRISGNGNVGIGVNSPNYNLEVYGNISSYSGAFYGLDESMHITTNTEFELLRTRNGAGIWGKKLTSNNNGCLLFKTHSLYNTPVTRMMITDGGYIGMGTTSPGSFLHVKGDIATDVMRIENTNSNGFASIQCKNNVGTFAYAGIGCSLVGNLANKFYLSNNSVTEVILTNDGKVGINIRDPSYPLTVVGGVQTGNTVSYAALYGTYPWQNQTADYLTSIYGQYFIIAGYGFASFSDNRIKKNIIDVDDASALEVIRQIQPKRYSYIDEVKKGTEPVWGFIAQQVKGVLDYATSTITEFVPNVYDKADVVKTSDNAILITLQSKTLDLDMTDNATGKIRLYSFNQGSQDKELTVTIKEMISENSFTIEETDVLQDAIECFVWGQQIKDFNVLNKDAIFTVSVAALQEVDRELQATRSELAETRSQLQDLLARVAALENK
jgi:hypothetical protein